MADLGPQGEVRMGCFLHMKVCVQGVVYTASHCWRRNPIACIAFHPDDPACRVHLPPHACTLPSPPVFPQHWGASEGSYQEPRLLDRGRES